MKGHIDELILQKTNSAMNRPARQPNYLDEEILNALREHGGLFGLTSMVFARANHKEKIMDANETFIEIYPGKVDTISDIPLLARRVTRSVVKNYYFYLYYETTCPTAKERKRDAALLRDAVKV